MTTTTDYEGEASNVSLLASVDIASSTNATPIEITTSTPHDFVDGETIEISGHETNVNANGEWPIVVVSAMKFTLTGSVGVGVGGATGSALAWAPRPALPIPDGTALPAMSTFAPLIESLEDRVAHLSARAGSHGLRYPGASIIADDAAWSTVKWSSDATGAADTWTENRKNGAGTVGHGFTELAASVIRDVKNSDELHIEFHTTLDAGVVVTAIDFSLFLLIADYGVAPTFAAATRITGSRKRILAGYFGPLELRGRRFVFGLTHGKYARVYLGAKSPAGGDAYSFQGDAELLVTPFRSAS